MSEWSGFFDAHKQGDSWDRVYLAEDFARFFSPLIGNGVFAGKSNELQVFQNVPASMSVVVSSGQSWIDGYGYLNDSDLVIPIGPADGALGRIDRVVNQWSSVDRRIRTVWKKGTPAVNPVAPPLRWDADYKELNICILDVSAGLSAITQDKIRDTRADSSVCGWVTGLIDQVDTSTLFAQWESAYEKEFTEQKRAWEEFFKDIQLDLGIPVPSPDKAKHVLAVDSNGGYILSNEYASKKYADTRKAYNLLDNSDFRNPVNQRGKTNYNSGTDTHTIDRWILGGVVNLVDGGVSVVSGVFRQRVEHHKKNQVYTLAAEDTDGNMHMYSCIPGAYADEDGTRLEMFVANTGLLTVGLPTGLTYKWAALYEGEYTADNLPVYQPKGYGVELAECQRYFIKYNFYEGMLPGKSYSANPKYADVMLTTPVNMRITSPTISTKTTYCGVAVHGDTYPGSLSGTTHATGNAVNMVFTATDSIPTNSSLICRIVGELSLSADL